MFKQAHAWNVYFVYYASYENKCVYSRFESRSNVLNALLFFDNVF